MLDNNDDRVFFSAVLIASKSISGSIHSRGIAPDGTVIHTVVV